MSKTLLVILPLISILFFGIGAFAAPVNGAWTSSVGGNNLLLVLQERADGRIIGYVSGQRGTLISTGAHSGTTITLTITHTDPGSSGSGTFSGTLAGSTITGTYTEGSSSTAMTLTKTTASYKTENWLFTNSSSSVQNSFGRVKTSTGSFDSGSFIGNTSCTFLACGGTISSWSATAGSHSIATSSSGSCSSTSSLSGTFNTTSRILSGTFSTTDCTSTTTGSYSALKTGMTSVSGTRSVLKLLSNFADAIESESTSIGDFFTAYYMNNGTTKSAAIAELTTIFSNYSSLSVAINGLEEVTTENDSEVHSTYLKRARVKWSMTVTGVPTSSTTPVTIGTISSDETSSTYYWVKLSSGTATFSGNGEFELQTPYTDIAGVSNAHPFVTSAASTTPGDLHNGIDFMHNTPTALLTIRAPAGGVIQADSPIAPWLNTNGYQVNIKIIHSDTKFSEMAFETFSTVEADGDTQASSAYIPVSNGMAVEAGDVIGILFVPVSTSAAHVHYGFYVNSSAVCPSSYFSSSAQSEILSLIQIWDSTATSMCKVE